LWKRTLFKQSGQGSVDTKQAFSSESRGLSDQFRLQPVH